MKDGRIMFVFAVGVALLPIAVFAQRTFTEGLGSKPPLTMGAPTARAGTGTASLSPQAREMMEKRDRVLGTTPGASGRPLPGQMEERKTAAADRLNAGLLARAKEFVRVTVTRMRAAIDRLVKIGDRIDSRIAKEEANGKDISQARAAMATARGEIEQAKAALQNAESLFDSYVPPALSSSTGTPERVQPGMGQPSPMRDVLKQADVAIRAAHKALTDAVRMLMSENGTATTTASLNAGKPPKRASSTPNEGSD